MKYTLTGLILVSIALSGCGSTMAVAPSPASGKVYVTETHSFLIFTASNTKLCDSAGSALSGCQQVTVE